MKSNKQSADFLDIGDLLLAWYQVNGRDLPFRKTSDPYHIWICEIIFQQTRIQQGILHYQNFVRRFPTVLALACAETDEVMLYWKGLGYYSRALNLHYAAQQIVNEHHGKFPERFEDILKLKGVGKYTAAAISSICFGEQRPAVDGNFYRVLSRIFSDGFEISSSNAFDYFSQLALKIMPEDKAGDFNQAIMDLGSEICKPRNPLCLKCPLHAKCSAFRDGRVAFFPVKSKKTKVEELALSYYFINDGQKFLAKRRDAGGIWKNLYEFPDFLPENLTKKNYPKTTLHHKLTHRNLTIHIYMVKVDVQFLEKTDEFIAVKLNAIKNVSFPTPLQKFLEKFSTGSAQQLRLDLQP